jgi:ribosomal subunit interface protein
MNIRITFRGMESSGAVEKYLAERNKKLERMLTGERDPINLEIILEAQPVHAQFAVELRLHAADYHVRAHKQGTDLYGLIDSTFDVLVSEIRKFKGKNITKRKGREATKRKIV